MVRRLLIGTGWFFLVVLPLVSMAAAGGFAAYPGETEPFLNLLGNAISIVYTYGGIPGVALIILHEAVLSRAGQTRRPRILSIVVGIILGTVLGLLLAKAVVWDLATPMLAIMAGGLYGYLMSPRYGRRDSTAVSASHA
jgi:hypothetical protein